MRNVEAEHGQDACQALQNNGKFQRSNDRIDHAAHKFDGRSDEFLRILLDTLVDVVRRVAAHLQAVVVFVGKPARSQNFIEPFRPFNRQALIEKVVNDVVKRPYQYHAGVHRCKHPKCRSIQILHRIVKSLDMKVLNTFNRTSVNSSVTIAVISSNTLTVLFGVRQRRRI